jgi:hypothetical protein
MQNPVQRINHRSLTVLGGSHGKPKISLSFAAFCLQAHRGRNKVKVIFSNSTEMWSKVWNCFFFVIGPLFLC